MVGFEDSVNMVEEIQDPLRIFPRTMLTGLGIAVVIYMLVAISVVAVIPPGQIAEPTNAEAGILLDVVKTGAPDLPIDKLFPFLTVFAVANTALINMLMASRLIYGMARQDVLPRSLGKVLPGRRSPWTAILFTTLLALGLIAVVTLQSDNSVVSALSGTTATLLLAVFTVVNIACLVLRRDPRPEGAFQRTQPAAGRRRGVLRLPARPVGPHRGRHDPVQDRRRPARHRRGAVAAHLADQPRRARPADRVPRHRAHGRRGPLTRTGAGGARPPVTSRAAAHHPPYP